MTFLTRARKQSEIRPVPCEPSNLARRNKKFAFELTSSGRTGFVPYFLGLYRYNGVWRWSGGQLMSGVTSSGHWWPGDPNENADCAVMELNPGHPGFIPKLADTPCTDTAWNTHDIEDVFSGATRAQVTEVYPNLWSENSDVQTVVEDVQAIAASDPHCSSWGSNNASSEDILMEIGTSSWNRSVCAVFHMEKKSTVVVGMKVWMVLVFLVHLFIELFYLMKTSQPVTDVHRVSRMLRFPLMLVFVLSLSKADFWLGCRQDLIWQMGVLAVLLSSFHVVLTLNKVPRFSGFMPVDAMHLFRFSLAFVPLILFQLLLTKNASFSSVLVSFFKMITRMLGDLGYDTFQDDQSPVNFPIMTQILFLIFIILEAPALISIHFAKSETTPLTSKDAEEDDAQRGNEMDIDEAIVSGNVEEVKRLITKSSDPDTMIRDKKLLHKTVSFGKRKNFVVLNILLKHVSLETLTQRYENDKTVLHIAVEKGHDHFCELILKKNKALLTSVDKEGDTPLHYAAKYGQTNVCKKIHAYLTPEVINQQNAKNFTPLHFAAREKRHGIMKILLEKGGDPRMTTKQGYTPLHFAARSGSLDCVTQLLATQTCSEGEKEYVNMQTEQLKTALMFAAQSGFATICKKLSATDVTISDVDGKTALHFAATKDIIPVAQFLIDELGADCFQRDGKQERPLDIALTKKNDKCFNFFLQKIPDEKLDDNVIKNLVVLAAGSSLKCFRYMAERQSFHKYLESFKDDKNNNLLHLTIANKSYATAKQLLEKNVSFDRLATNEDGETPLHLLAKQSTACLNCHEEDIQWVTRNLLRNSHDIVNMPNKKGETPLHLAAQAGNLEILKSLRRKDPEVLKVTKQNLTALHYAAQQGHADSLKLLLRSLKTADFAKLREIQVHPLHLASKNGHLECCKLLTSSGSEDGTDNTLFSPNQGGKYPVDHAFKGKHAELFHFLLCKMKFNKKHEELSGRLHHYFEKCVQASDR
ncbi:ankyrin-3-like [Hyalella azteca]|uniref:Ankyrin-3-like n=1 Tax=Hyalella azteca TaxID=294128 RepID=A0A8B7NGE6_HYAAZ|nr:ankyrin-3-like [Hyalella azteca]